ncbi:MAG: RIP metalloprotease RseP [Candidatus Scalindua sp.]|jgi:regulator of sigma E protease|nr:RIP metalloprotease RseP [Candidatus Scalindua sp.]MDV5167024.1 RIP metalloprotease RseP [Candidatus Scalindua sp.]
MPFIGISSNVVLVIIGIGLLIFIHELGHFLVAKKIGVRVHAFSLGFGPAIISKQFGETEYRVSLIPLGGYVKLAGEQREDSNTGEAWEFMSKKPWQRAAVLVAGVTCNTILAFILFIVAFNVGVPFITSEIGQAMPGGPAWEAGIRAGDKIVRIDNVTEPDFEDIFISIALSGSPAGVNMEVERDNETFSVNVVPEYDASVGVQRIGIAPASTLEVDKIFTVENADAPANVSELNVNDEIIAVNGKAIATANDFRKIVNANPGKELNLAVLRNEQKRNIKVTPSVVTRWMIGLSCATSKLDGVKKDSFAYSLGLEKGDEVVKVNAHYIHGFSELISSVKDSPDGMITLQVKRGNEVKNIKFTKQGEKTVKEFSEGIFPHYGLIVDSTVEGFPAEKSGIKPGDKITSISGENITEWSQLLTLVTASKGNEFEIAWSHNYETVTKTIKPQKNEKSAQGVLGIKFREKKEYRRYGFFKACSVGTHKTVINIKRIYLTIQGFLSKKLSTKALGGPVLIAQASYASAQSGIGKLMYFMAIISINLAVINILPVPVLDGGHLMFLGIEKLKGSPVSEKTMAIANYIGMGLVLTLMVYATKNDIMRLFHI